MPALECRSVGCLPRRRCIFTLSDFYKHTDNALVVDFSFKTYTAPQLKIYMGISESFICLERNLILISTASAFVFPFQFGPSCFNWRDLFFLSLDWRDLF